VIRSITYAGDATVSRISRKGAQDVVGLACVLSRGLARAIGPGPRLRSDLHDLVRSLSGLFDPYRPERHYMRGPGPKWRAKHGAFADRGQGPSPPTLD
jgi:hypothetical protein